YDRKSGQRRPLTDGLDAHVGDAAWAPDSRRVYFTTSLRARPRIYMVDLDGGAPKELVEIAVSEAQGLAVRRGALLYLASTLSRPADVYRLPLDERGR